MARRLRTTRAAAVTSPHHTPGTYTALTLHELKHPSSGSPCRRFCQPDPRVSLSHHPRSPLTMALISRSTRHAARRPAHSWRADHRIPRQRSYAATRLPAGNMPTIFHHVRACSTAQWLTHHLSWHRIRSARGSLYGRRCIRLFLSYYYYVFSMGFYSYFYLFNFSNIYFIFP